jgi:hypothetical protein
MESEQRKPDWEKCPCIVEKLAEAKKAVAEYVGKGELRFQMPEEKVDLFVMSPNMLGAAFVFPHEFRPDSSSGWNGLTFPEWFAYITGPHCPRP